MSCETNCACCHSEVPRNEQIHALATAGFMYMQWVTDSTVITTASVMERFLSNLPEDKEHEDKLFSLALMMIQKQKNTINEIKPGLHDEMMGKLFEEYANR